MMSIGLDWGLILSDNNCFVVAWFSVRTGRVGSACSPTPVHAGPPIVPVQAVAHRIISATRALRGDLLHQGSRPTWAKLSRSPKKPPRLSDRPSTRLSFSKTHQRSHPAPSREETSGLPYQRVPTPPTRPQQSPRPPTPISPHRWLLVAAKEIQIAHDQRTVRPHHPVRPLSKIVT